MGNPAHNRSRIGQTAWTLVTMPRTNNIRTYWDAWHSIALNEPVKMKVYAKLLDKELKRVLDGLIITVGESQWVVPKLPARTVQYPF